MSRTGRPSFLPASRPQSPTTFPAKSQRDHPVKEYFHRWRIIRPKSSNIIPSQRDLPSVRSSRWSEVTIPNLRWNNIGARLFGILERNARIFSPSRGKERERERELIEYSARIISPVPLTSYQLPLTAQLVWIWAEPRRGEWGVRPINFIQTEKRRKKGKGRKRKTTREREKSKGGEKKVEESRREKRKKGVRRGRRENR